MSQIVYLLTVKWTVRLININIFRCDSISRFGVWLLGLVVVHPVYLDRNILIKENRVQGLMTIPVFIESNLIRAYDNDNVTYTQVTWHRCEMVTGPVLASAQAQCQCAPWHTLSRFLLCLASTHLTFLPQLKLHYPPWETFHLGTFTKAKMMINSNSIF